MRQMDNEPSATPHLSPKAILRHNYLFRGLGANALETLRNFLISHSLRLVGSYGVTDTAK